MVGGCLATAPDTPSLLHATWGIYLFFLYFYQSHIEAKSTALKSNLGQLKMRKGETSQKVAINLA